MKQHTKYTYWLMATVILALALYEAYIGQYYAALGFTVLAFVVSPVFTRFTYLRKHRRNIKLLLIAGGIFLANREFDPAVFFTPKAASAPVQLVSVADGDTVTVLVNGVKEKIRIVGIDAPEYNPKECYREEATQALKAMLDGTTITLEQKRSEDRDVFGRMLRYVHADGADVGLELVRQGFAVSYKRYPHERLISYEAKQVEAKLQQKGMWGSCNL